MTEIDSSRVPLVVDLDGTMIRSDLLIESALSYFSKHPFHISHFFSFLRRGKAALKKWFADTVDLDPATLPYDQIVIEQIQLAVADGRPVYLASASNERYVASIASYLNIFDGWYASDATNNLSGAAKAARLVEIFGERGFDYIGNDKADLPVWSVSRKKIAIRVSKLVNRKLLALDPNADFLPSARPSLKTWMKTLRVHQYAKNILVFIPLLTAQRLELSTFFTALHAAIAFSMCTSSIYILNDLVDLSSDRSHPTKCKRPLAAGNIPLPKALLVALVLFCLSVVSSYLVSFKFFIVLAGYFVLTTAYTFFLKRKMLIDVIALAMFYTIRVIGGATAIGVVTSEWLLAFSMLIFTSLALIKRYTELTVRFETHLPDPSNRNYKIGDRSIIAMLSAAAGFNAITVFALYISSDAVHKLYRHPQWLWLICPILMYWLSRMLILAHRGLMNDDPILFALKDRNSIASAVLIGAMMAAAV